MADLKRRAAKIKQRAARVAAVHKQAEDANSSYQSAHTLAMQLTNEIAGFLARHSNAQSKDPTNWGYVGDMNHYIELLEEILGTR
jgi:hypothetical protein